MSKSKLDNILIKFRDQDIVSLTKKELVDILDEVDLLSRNKDELFNDLVVLNEDDKINLTFNSLVEMTKKVDVRGLDEAGKAKDLKFFLYSGSLKNVNQNHLFLNEPISEFLGEFYTDEKKIVYEKVVRQNLSIVKLNGWFLNDYNHLGKFKAELTLCDVKQRHEKKFKWRVYDINFIKPENMSYEDYLTFLKQIMKLVELYRDGGVDDFILVDDIETIRKQYFELLNEYDINEMAISINGYINNHRNSALVTFVWNGEKWIIDNDLDVIENEVSMSQQKLESNYAA